MLYREALSSEIKQIQDVRNSVKENMLSDPALVPDKDVEEFINQRGKGWVCEINGQIVGFSIADLKDDNIWALFLDPEFEGRGIGKVLHQLMLDWYFEQGKKSVWLGTAPNSRAEKFYHLQGWREVGMHGKEIKFEMSREDWSSFKKKGNYEL